MNSNGFLNSRRKPFKRRLNASDNSDSRRGYGMLNSAATISKNNLTGKKFWKKNRYNNTYYKESLKQHESELLSFKQRIDNSNDVIVKFELLTKRRLAGLDLNTWLSKFEKLYKANNWNCDQVKLALDVLVEDDSKPEDIITSQEELMKDFKRKLFPETCFLELETKLRSIKAARYKTLKEFFRDFLIVFDQAQMCLPIQEKFTERDKRHLFIRALNQEQQELYIDFDQEGLQEFVEFYDNRQLKKMKYNYFSQNLHKEEQ